MKSVCFSGRKLSRLWVPCRKPLPDSPPEPMAILAWVMFQPAPSASDSGIEEGHAPAPSDSRAAQSARRAAPPPPPPASAGAIHHQDRPARNSSEQPSITMIRVVPRLGSITTSTAGMRDHGQRDGQLERLGDFLHALAVQKARKRQHQRDLHQLGRLQFQRPQHDPALGAQADMAGHLHRDQQQQRQAIGRIGQRSSRPGHRSAPPPPGCTSPRRSARSAARPRDGNARPPPNRAWRSRRRRSARSAAPGPNSLPAACRPMRKRALGGGIGANALIAARALARHVRRRAAVHRIGGGHAPA